MKNKPQGAKGPRFKTLLPLRFRVLAALLVTLVPERLTASHSSQFIAGRVKACKDMGEMSRHLKRWEWRQKMQKPAGQRGMKNTATNEEGRWFG